MKERPKWCKHPDCQILKPGDDGCMCVGRLPQPTDHHEFEGVNTHRMCLSNSDEKDEPWNIDLMVNVGDIMHFVAGMNRILLDDKRMTYQHVGEEYWQALDALGFVQKLAKAGNPEARKVLGWG